MARSAAYRKYQLTFNNPADHGFSHEVIKTTLSGFSGCVYWCMCDEIGELPPESDKRENQSEQVLAMLDDGASNEEIVRAFLRRFESGGVYELLPESDDLPF